MELEKKFFLYYNLANQLEKTKQIYTNYKGTSEEKRHVMKPQIEGACNGLENAIKVIVERFTQDAVDEAVDGILDERIMTLISEKSESLTGILTSQMESHFENLSNSGIEKIDNDNDKDKEKEKIKKSDNTNKKDVEQIY